MLKRLLALLCVLLLIAGSLCRAFQDVDALQGHVVCPEHGELIHVATGVGSDVDELTLPPADLAHGEECALVALGTTPADSVAKAPTVHHPAGAMFRHEGVAASATQMRIPPLQFAPKASPPTV